MLVKGALFNEDGRIPIYKNDMEQIIEFRNRKLMSVMIMRHLAYCSLRFWLAVHVAVLYVLQRQSCDGENQ